MSTAKWKPINTAPRDGTVVDLRLTGGGRVTDQWWVEEDKTWCGLEDEMFSHWAPLPEFEAPSELLALADRLKAVNSGEIPLTGEVCKHGWDRSVCVLRGCNNPYALDTLLEEAEQMLRRASVVGEEKR